jgi:phage terminase large subunit-like protein
MVLSVLRAADRAVPVKLVHASRGKVVRAEPISALYEQNRIHHVGRHDELEDQMCTFSVDNTRGMNGVGSPDRVDALVWGFTELFSKITARRRSNPDTTDKDHIVRGLNYQKAVQETPNGWMAG